MDTVPSSSGTSTYWKMKAPHSLETSRSGHPMTQPNIPEEWIPFSCGIFAFACFLLSWYQNVSVHFCCLLQFVLHNRNSTFSEMCQLYIMPLSAVCYASVSCMLCLCQLCYASVSCMSRLCQLYVMPLSAVLRLCQLYVTPLSAVCYVSGKFSNLEISLL